MNKEIYAENILIKQMQRSGTCVYVAKYNHIFYDNICVMWA